MNKKSITAKYGTNIEKLRNMSDEDIDLTDLPTATPEMMKNAVVRKKLKHIGTNSQEILPIDQDIIEYFKSQDFNYPAKINQLLREYMEAHENK